MKSGLHWLLFFIFIQLLFFVLSSVLIIFFEENLRLFFVLFAISALFGIMDFTMRKSFKMASQSHLLEEKVKIASTQLKTQASYYEALTDEINKYRKLRHDQYNFLCVLLSLLNSGEIAETRVLLEQEAGKLTTSAIGYCRNFVVDSILSINKNIAGEYNIEYIIDIILENNIGIDQIDLCSVFSNILNNAVEACKEVKSGRLIMLSAAVKSGCLIIRCKNTKSNEIVHSSGNKLLSSKGHDPDHGLGLAIISDIAQKYDGSVDVKHDDQYFQITVFLICVAVNSLV